MTDVVLRPAPASLPLIVTSGGVAYQSLENTSGTILSAATAVSSNPSVATVSLNTARTVARIVGVSNGSATITYTRASQTFTQQVTVSGGNSTSIVLVTLPSATGASLFGS